jgi:excisionase family DNA binding protein
MAQATTSRDRLLTVKQLGEKLGWSIQKIHRLIAAKKIPHLRLEGRTNCAIHFRESEVEAWLEAQRVPVIADSESEEYARLTREAECRRLGIPVDHEFT